MAKTQINPDAMELIENYIDSSPEFARPICRKLREIILKTDSGIIEDWKWGPNYQKDGMICGYGAFKKHVKLAFFKGSLMKDPYNILKEGESNLNTRSVNFKSVDEINEKIISEYVKEAVKINKSGKKPEKTELEIPSDMKKVLKANSDAKKIFDKLAYTHKKEYILWIKEAKKEETRERRLGRFVQMLISGKKEP
jgi:uncharacterized protein YdeI (YjbR/CyaY-like superfamily)